MEDKNIIIKKSLKYFIEFFVILIAIQYISSIQLPLYDGVLIAIMGTCAFAILDVYLPIVIVK